MSKSDLERDQQIGDLIEAAELLIEAVREFRKLWTSPKLDQALDDAERAAASAAARQR